MLEKFQEEIKTLTPGQRWRMRKFLYRLEERELSGDELDDAILDYFAKEILGETPVSVAHKKQL